MTNDGVTYVTDNVNSVTGSDFEKVTRNATDNVTGESIAELYRAEMLHYMKLHPIITTEKMPTFFSFIE